MADTPFDPKYVRATANTEMVQYTPYPKVPMKGVPEMVENAVFDPSSRLLDYLRANTIIDDTPTRSTRDSSGRDLGSDGASAFDHVIAMPVIDIGRNPREENPEHSIHKGSFFITFDRKKEFTDTIDYSVFDTSLNILTPSSTELAIFDYIYDEECLDGCKPITMCAMAVTAFVRGHEKEVLSHSVFHHVEVLPASVDDVPSILDEAKAPEILKELISTELYTPRVLSSNRPLAIAHDSLYIIPIVVSNGSGYKVHYIPAINLTIDNIRTIKQYMNRGVPVTIQACFAHVYFIGPLLLPHRKEEDFWYVSYQVDRY